MTRAAPYRIPLDPGYVGGYNWPAMLAGIALLMLWEIFSLRQLLNAAIDPETRQELRRELNLLTPPFKSPEAKVG